MFSQNFKYLFFLLFSVSLLYSLEVDTSKPFENWTNSNISYVNDHEAHINTVTHGREFFNQWFTGPLLMPSPVTANPKNPLVEFSVTVGSIYANYDNDWKLQNSDPNVWSVEYLPYWQMGFTTKLGCEIFTVLKSTYTSDISTNYFTDTSFRLGYQILADRNEKGNWIPDFRVILEEIFPTGRYQMLNPNNNLLDATGQGSFQTGLYLAAQKSFAWSSNHAFHLSSAFGYFILASAKVVGFNTYGGSKTTNGRVYPGNNISAYFSGEFEITKHLAFAFDSIYQQNLPGWFNGKEGDGNPVILPQVVTFEFAPELEIIINRKMGLIVGPWFSFAGQNSPAFVSFFVNYMYVF